MAFKHGIYWNLLPTAISATITADSAFTVAFGTAPIFKGIDGEGNVNRIVYAATYAEAVNQLGYSDDWQSWTLCEVIKNHFANYGVGGIAFVNVFDPDDPDLRELQTETAMPVVNKRVVLGKNAMPMTVEAETTASVPLVRETDFLLSWDREDNLFITLLGLAASETTINVTWYDAKPEEIVATDVIGGVDPVSGEPTGLELVEQVFPKLRKVPAIIIAPGWSKDPTVAAVMNAKADIINGVFKNATAIVDVPSPATMKYNEVAEWKSLNNYTLEHQIVCWPRVTLGDAIYHLSTHIAAKLAVIDRDRGGIPSQSPSNQTLSIDGVCYDDGTEINLGLDQVNDMLGANGIMTAINFSRGWTAWNNYMACYPGETDPAKFWIVNHRMNAWKGNSLVLSYWSKVDLPMSRMLVDNIVDTENLALNGLAPMHIAPGAHLTFVPELSDFANGKCYFHLRWCPYPAAQEIEFGIEIDFAQLAAALAA